MAGRTHSFFGPPLISGRADILCNPSPTGASMIACDPSANTSGIETRPPVRELGGMKPRSAIGGRGAPPHASALAVLFGVGATEADGDAAGGRRVTFSSHAGTSKRSDVSNTNCRTRGAIICFAFLC